MICEGNQMIWKGSQLIWEGKKLIWKDKVHLDEGLNRTLNWINKNYKSLKKEKYYYIHRK